MAKQRQHQQPSARTSSAVAIGIYCRWSIIFLLMLFFCIGLVNGMTILTNGTEPTIIGLHPTNEQLAVFTHWAIVENHNELDQCMRQPGSTRIMHHTLVLQLPLDGLNAGDGLILCYSGQMDKFNHRHGIVSDIPYRLYNAQGNHVAKICELSRAQLCQGKGKEKNDGHEEDEKEEDEECQAFAEWRWHGLQIVQDANGAMVISLSTTNEIFVLSHNAFNKDGRLFLKLASFDDLTSHVSRSFGPGYDEQWPHQDVTDHHRTIDNDKAHRDFFMEHAESGAYIRNHVGLWTLGIDILPRAMDTEINFFVMRSKCSEMAAAFLLPWEQDLAMLKPTPKIPINGKGEALVREMQFASGTTIWARGKVWPNVEHLLFMLENKLIRNKTQLKRIKLDVDFVQNQVIIKKIDASENRQLIGQNSNPLRPNQQFLLQFTIYPKYIEVRINCAEPIEYLVGDELANAFTDHHELIIDGADIYSLDQIGEAVVDKSLRVNVSGEQGYLVSGNLSQQWDQVRIELYRRVDFELHLLLSFTVRRREGDVLLKWWWSTKDGEETTLAVPIEMDQIMACGCLDVHFQLIVKPFGIVITLNGDPMKLGGDNTDEDTESDDGWGIGTLDDIFNDPLRKFSGNEVRFNQSDQQLEIKFIKIDNNLDIQRNTITMNLPGNFKKKFVIEAGISVKFAGRILRNAKEFQIDIYTGKEFSPKEPCLRDFYTCLVVIRFTANFTDNKLVIQQEHRKKTPHEDGHGYSMMKYFTTSATEPLSPFVPGKDFDFEIQFLGRTSFKMLSNNGSQFGGSEHYSIEEDEEDDTRASILITGDEGMLFDEPKVTRNIL